MTKKDKCPGNQRTKHSSGFMLALTNAKSQQSKLHLVLIINRLKFLVLLVVQSLIKSTSAKQLNVLVNIFHRKAPRDNISYIFTYLH